MCVTSGRPHQHKQSATAHLRALAANTQPACACTSSSGAAMSSRQVPPWFGTRTC